MKIKILKDRDGKTVGRLKTIKDNKKLSRKRIELEFDLVEHDDNDSELLQDIIFLINKFSI